MIEYTPKMTGWARKQKSPQMDKIQLEDSLVGAMVKEKLLWGYSHFHKQFSFPQEEPPAYSADYKPLTGVVCSVS